MVDVRPTGLNRKLLGQFLKSPEIIKAFENLSLNSDDMVSVIDKLQSAAVLVLGLSGVFENEREIAADDGLQLTDGGPGGKLTFGMSDSGVTPGVYGSATQLARVAVDGKGRVSLAQSIALNSDNVAEGGSNLFFTVSRARNSIGTTDPAAFVSTTTTTTATVPNAGQQPLYIPPGVIDLGTNATITATGAGQVVFGDGTDSQLADTSLKWVDFDYGGARGLYLRGTSDYGVSLESVGGGQTLRYAQFSDLLIRGKGKAINIAAASQLDVASVQFSDINAIGNTEGIYAVGGANLDFINIQSVANQRNAYLYGVGEAKIVNGRFQGATNGPNFEFYGDASRNALESYFINNNFNEGSATDNVTITNIAPYAGGTQIEVTCAAAHRVLVGYAKVIISGTTNYNATWTVADVTSPTVMILQIGPAAEPAGTYTVTETSGTFNRYHPGLKIHAASLGQVNDLFCYGGASNNTYLKNPYNFVMAMRGFGGKEHVYIEGNTVNRGLFFGSGRGRDGLNTYADVLPGGASSGYAMMGVFDPTASLSPGGQHTGVMAPMKDLGLAANQRPVAYAYSLTSETGHKIGVGAYPAMDRSWHWKRAGLGSHLYMTADTSARVTSDDLPNGIEMLGASAGNRPIIRPFGANPNEGITIQGKGTGSVDIEGGSVRQLRVNDIGLGFYGDTPVAKPTVTGSWGGNVAGKNLATALASMGLITDSTTA